MNYFKVLLFSFLLLTLNACDPCKDSVCLNGGVCEKGSCDCPAGYSGETCDIYDACHNVSCMNGGTCVDGDCDCPNGYSGVNCEMEVCFCYNNGWCTSGTCNCLPGYSGADCSVVLTPVSMSIYKIEAAKYPMTRTNGQGWDASSNPDVYLTVSQGATSVETDNVTLKSENNSNGGGFSSTINPNKLVNNLTSDWTVAAYDFDNPGPSELMDKITFVPMSKSSGFPATFTVSTADLEVKFHITWNF